MRKNNSFKRLVILAVAAIMLIGTAGIVNAAYVEIGTGTGTTRYMCNGLWDYSQSATIYLQSDIGGAKNIDAISLDMASGSSPYTMLDQRIWMAHTTLSQWPDTTLPDPLTMTQVYSNDITWGPTGWNTITLDTPFSYNGVDNLVIYWENHDGDYVSGYPYFYYTSRTYSILYTYGDNTWPPSYGPYRSSYQTNIRLHYSLANDVGVTSVSPSGLYVTTADPEVVPINVGVENFGTNSQAPGIPVTAEVWLDTYSYVLNENFNSDPGWTISGTTNGAWEFGVPTDPDGPAAAYTGSNVYGTDLDYDYDNDAATTLQTGAISLASTTNPMLKFALWYDTENSYDGGNLKISTDGSTFNILGSYLDPYVDDAASTANAQIPGEPCWTGHGQGYWEEIIFDLTSYAGGNIWLRWDFGSDGSVGGYPGMFIDDVQIYEVSSAMIYTCTDATTTTLNQGDTEGMTMSCPWSASPGMYRIEAYTGLGGDEDSSNDYGYSDVQILVGEHDVEATSIDLPNYPIIPPVPFSPVATVSNLGPYVESFYTEMVINQKIQMFEGWEVPIIFGARETPTVESLDIYDEKEFEVEKVTAVPVYKELSNVEPTFGDFGDWSTIDWDGDGITWQPDHTVYWSPDTSLMIGGIPGYHDDEISSPIFDLGSSPRITFYWYTDAVDPDEGIVMWVYDQFGFIQAGWIFTVPFASWWYVPDFTIPSGIGGIGFEVWTDGDGISNTYYLDDVIVTAEDITYDSYAYASLGIGGSTTLTFDTFTPNPSAISYDVGVRTLLDPDDQRHNDYLFIANYLTGKVYNVQKDVWYLSIQDAVDDADPGNTLQAMPGTYNENVVIDKDGITLEPYPVAGPLVPPNTQPPVTIDGYVLVPPTSLFYDDFSSDPFSAGWYTMNYGTNDWFWFGSGVEMYSGYYTWEDTELHSPTFSCVGQSQVTLEFDHYFYSDTSYPTYADVYVIIDGMYYYWIDGWYATYSAGVQTYDISWCAANEANVQIMFWYYDPANWGYYWDIYEVNIFGGGVTHGPCITIAADGVTVDNLNLINGDDGVYSAGTDGSTISNCWIHDQLNRDGGEGCGIRFDNGYTLDDFNQNEILDNLIYNNDRQGIFIGRYMCNMMVEQNLIQGNEIHDNGASSDAIGIHLVASHQNIIKENYIHNNNLLGLYLCSSYENTVEGNTFELNGIGVQQYDEGGCGATTNYVNCNYFLAPDCDFDRVAISNLDSAVMDARWNWYDRPNGPSGGIVDPVTGQVANGFGRKIEGNMRFDAWMGMHAEATASTLTAVVGEAIVFDGEGSFWNAEMCGLVPTYDYEIWLYDTYGDGWDETPYYGGPNLLDVLVNGVVVLDDIYLPSGSGPLKYSFSVNDGDLIELIYTCYGSYCSENEYELYDWQGNLVTRINGYNQPYYATNAVCPPPQEPENQEPNEYYWSFDDGHYSFEKTIAHVYTAPGIYNVYLRVRGFGWPGLWHGFMYDWAYLTVHVTSAGSALSANGDGQDLGSYETTVGEPITLYGIATGGSPPYYYNWELGDGKTSTEQNPTHIYEIAGTYTATLTVIDSEGDSATDTVTVTVNGIDELQANIQASSNGVTGVQMSFNSIVTGGTTPYTYSWDFGDGVIDNRKDPNHIFENEGTYTVTLTVTDFNGLTDTTSKTVEIVTDSIEEAVIKEIKGGIGITATIVAGEMNCAWTINVDGKYVFSGGQATGTIPANMEQTVKIPLTIALGKVTVTVTADTIQEQYTAFALGPFFLNLKEA